jgi:hypothetical protein
MNTQPLLSQISINSPSTRFNSYSNLVGDFTSLLLAYAIGIAGFWFLLRLILAGFNLLTSYGDQAKIDKARFDLLYATMGLIIVLSVFFIGQIIELAFGIDIL